MARSRAKTPLEISLPRLCLIGALLAAAGAPSAAIAQTVRIQPTLDTRLTWTDNVDTEEDGQQDWIAEVSPGVSISRESGRFSGGLNLRLRNTVHAEKTEDNATFLAVNGRGTIEAIEDAFFVDLGASVSRDNRSAFRGVSMATRSTPTRTTKPACSPSARASASASERAARATLATSNAGSPAEATRWATAKPQPGGSD